MDIEQILRETCTVAIVGASANPSRASHQVWRYLQSSSDYELVDVFRRHEHLPAVLEDTIKVGAKVLWLQLGLWHEQVARAGEAAGLQVVMDRCLKIDHARLLR